MQADDLTARAQSICICKKVSVINHDLHHLPKKSQKMLRVVFRTQNQHGAMISFPVND
jgi:hypothetical protein